jgi:hypothetical protein
VRRSVRLKLLTRLEAFEDSPGAQRYLELGFLQVGAGQVGGCCREGGVGCMRAVDAR